MDFLFRSCRTFSPSQPKMMDSLQTVFGLLTNFTDYHFFPASFLLTENHYPPIVPSGFYARPPSVHLFVINSVVHWLTHRLDFDMFNSGWFYSKLSSTQHQP